MFYSRSVIVFALCFLSCADLAFSKVEKCYKCFSEMNYDCSLNANQEKFVVNCTDDFIGGFISNLKMINSSERESSNSSIEYTCVKAVITMSLVGNTTTTLVARGCGTKDTCDTKTSYPALNITAIKTCDVCTYDLCNSSTVISAGFYGVIISLILLFVFWK